MKFLTNENFEGAIYRGLLHRKPDIDLVRVQAVGLSEADDPTILPWADKEGRVLLTQDRRTMPRYAYQMWKDHTCAFLEKGIRWQKKFLEERYKCLMT